MKKSDEKHYFFSDKSIWKQILEIFAASRLLLVMTAWFSNYYQGNVIYQRYIDQGFFLSPKWLIDIWCRWDSEWHLSIVKWGYVASEDISSTYSNIAFFPLYPYLIKLFTFWMPERFQTESVYLLVGLIISNISLVLAMYGIAKLAEKLFCRTTALSAILVMFCLPCGFYFSAFYGESLFLCLIVYTLILAENGQWKWSALCAAGAALCRPHGVLVLLPVICIYMSGINWDFRKIGTAWLWYLLVPAAVCGFFYGLYTITGDFFAFFKAQSSWGRSLTDTSAFALYFEPLHTRHNRPTTIDLIMICTSLILSIMLLIQHKNKAYGIYSLVCTLVLIGTGNLYSMMRYTAVIFPIWIYLADLLGKHKKIFGFVCTTFYTLQILLFCGWINYYWIA
ncbi:MAG: hypothetical protein IJI14_09575 [Anaerolineaceae bacterium]|nr:hypothetical protein [Anaerolineaceae bacterium]